MRKSKLKNIKREHVLKAIEIVEEEGMFPSFKYELVYKGNRYSPVDVIKIASKEANGVEFGTLSGGKQTNNVLIDLGFSVVLKGTNQIIVKDHSDGKRKLFEKSVSFPELQPDNRLGVSKVYNNCEEDVRDTTIYEYLFNSRSQKWININVIDCSKNYDWESPAQAILQYVGIRSHHKGIFQGCSLKEAINILEQQNIDVSIIIESLSIINNKSNVSEKEKKIEDDIDSQMAEEDSYYKKEGGVKEFYGNRYERNTKNRLKCIESHGLSCKVCDFNFEEVYGERGKDFIEVHHVSPLSTLGEQVVIDPKKDLVPVCSNCHRMIHRKKDYILTVKKLRFLITQQNCGDINH